MNYIEELFIKYPNMDEKMILYLSKHGKISSEFVMNNLHISWSMENFNCSDFPLEFILDHLEFKWNLFSLSQHPQLTLKIIEDNPGLDVIHFYIHNNSHFEISWIRKHPDWDWNMTKITAYFATEKLVDEYPDINWSPTELSDANRISIEFVVNHPEIKWTHHIIDKKGLTKEIITAHPEIDWPKNCLIDLEDDIKKILQNPVLNKHAPYLLHLHRNFSLDLLEEYPEVEWDYESIFYRFGLSLDFAGKYINANWNIDKFINRTDCSIEFLIEHPELRCEYDSTMSNYIKDKLDKKEKRINEWNAFIKACMHSKKCKLPSELSNFMNNELFDINLLKCIKQYLL